MYPATPQDHAFKSIDWRAFVAAMVDAGFVARQKGGSNVNFEKGGISIVLHKTHPVEKIDPVMLRSTGKRLARWFGLGRECFVERVKVDEEVEGKGKGKGLARD